MVKPAVMEALHCKIECTAGPDDDNMAFCIFAGELSIARLICSGELNPEHI